VQRAVIIKELEDLRRAHVLAKNEITDFNLCTSIREEINILIGELEKKKRSLANPLRASTSNSQQQQTKSKKKRKIEQKQEHHKGQMRGQLSGLAEKLEEKERKPQQEQQQKQDDKPEEKKQKQEDEPEGKEQKQQDKAEEKKRKQEDKPEEKQQQNKQKHEKRPRQRTPKVPTQGYPAMWNAALRGDLERPPYAAMHGVHHGYPAQPGWPGVHCESLFMPQLGAPEYIGPFTPLYPRPQFYPR
jgi:cobalamin biosynthesis protein CobT